jgi:hypothetical protein
MPTGGVTSVGHGLTLTFLAGSYIQDDLYKFNTYGSIASLFAAVDAQMTAAALAYKWAFAILELPSATDALIAKALAGLASAEGRVMVTGGFCTLASATSSPGGASYSRPDGWPIAARVAGSEISEDLGRVKSGPVGGISALARDEQVTPGFGVLHVETLRTIPGRNGIYIASDTDGNMMSAVGSDYSFVQFRRIMDRACVLALPVAQGELNDDILADPVTGFILASEADRIEGIIDAAVRSELMSSSNALRKPHVSALLVSVKRDEAILLTKNITVDIALVPKGYAKSIGVYIHYSLSLPASVAAAA